MNQYLTSLYIFNHKNNVTKIFFTFYIYIYIYIYIQSGPYIFGHCHNFPNFGSLCHQNIIKMKHETKVLILI